ncbi:MAG: ATP-grasp domain-containing protein [Armatimonas sp.]
MPTLIFPDRPGNWDISDLKYAATALKWNTYAMRYRVPNDIQFDNPVLYGDPLFCDIVAAQLGVRLIEPPHDLLLRLDPRFTKRQIALSTLAKARKDLSRPMFVKSAIDKSIAARVYSSGADLPDQSVASDDLPVLLSEPVRWLQEWRLFIRWGRILAHSLYFRDGILDIVRTREEKADMLRYAEPLVEEIVELLPDGVVLDIGIIEGAGWAVVEANPVWGGGIYGCEPPDVLRALEVGTVSLDSNSPFLRPVIQLEEES